MSTLLSPLEALVAAQAQGEALGIASICSAHPEVLQAAVVHAVATGRPLLIESTSNQVNQDGGYTGMTPAAFARFVRGIAHSNGLPPEQLVLGGDHLGPNPWRHAPASEAMDRARMLVRDCVLAGYTKIHLDASMRCADDAPDAPLPTDVVAARAAELCAVAEAAHGQLAEGSPAPCYVIGTEVPPPGGEEQAAVDVATSSVGDTEVTIDLTHRAFADRGLAAAWDRVCAVVVQPGVEFGDDVVFDYRRERAAPLAHLIERHATLVYEAHSTDYQTRHALRQMVEDHFAILKVGPALTFAYREAVLALAQIETALVPEAERSRLIAVLESTMLAHPEHWQAYYHGTPAQQRIARLYSFSDRIRYYWPQPAIQAAVRTLVQGLSARHIPLTLLSQALPRQYVAVREGRLRPDPTALVRDKITEVLEDYAAATG